MKSHEEKSGPLHQMVADTLDTVEEVLERTSPTPALEEVGRIIYVGHGIARVEGLPGARSEELLLFPDHRMGLAFNLDIGEVGVILLNSSAGLAAGNQVKRTGRILDVPVGEQLIGRVVDAVGRPLDEKGPLSTGRRFSVEREAPPIMHRAPVTVPLQTGLKVVDALIPIGRGQRQLILGDRQTGKTAIALDTILNQKDKNVICIYCAIGQRASSVARIIADLEARGTLDYTAIVVTTENDPPGLQFITPYAGMSMGEYFMEQGRDVLIVFDDLTRHARAYRELSLLLRRPPGREAYPGDIFYIHSRLLERSTHLRPEYGGGSLTALPICETEAQNLSAYIPTNLISITDGQIYLSPDLFHKSVLPAVDVGRSVSRVGGKTQLPAYRGLAGDLRLSYAQFSELEIFARFGTRLDEATREALERGRNVREILKQNQYEPLTVAEQIAVLVAVNAGLFAHVPAKDIAGLEKEICQAVTAQLPHICQRIEAGEKLKDEDRAALEKLAEGVIASSLAKK